MSENEGGGVAGLLGFFLGAGLTLVESWIILVILISGPEKKVSAFLMSGFLYFGVIVTIYWFLRSRKPSAASGLVLGAGMIVLLDAMCAASLRR